MRRPAVLLIAALAFAQAPPRARIAIGLDAIDGVRLKADLTFLASDALEGRRSLERGSEVAIQWIASEFAKAGLKPLVGDSYFATGAADRVHRGQRADQHGGAARRQKRDVSCAGRDRS